MDFVPGRLGGAGAARGAEGGHGGGSLAQSSASCICPSWQGLSASGQPSPGAQHLYALLFSQGKWLNAKCVYVKILPKAVSLKTGHLHFSSAAAMSGARLCGVMGRGAPSPAPGAQGGHEILSEPPLPMPRARPCTEPRAAWVPRAWRHGRCSLVRLLQESRQGSWRVAEAAMPIPLFITASYTNKIFTSLP